MFDSATTGSGTGSDRHRLVSLAATCFKWNLLTCHRLSKQLTDMTYMNGIRGVRERVVELNTKAVEVASLAVQLDASVPLAHIARCVSRGRLALVSDNRTKVRPRSTAAAAAAAVAANMGQPPIACLPWAAKLPVAGCHRVPMYSLLPGFPITAGPACKGGCR